MSDRDARALELAAIATRAIDAYMAKDFTGAMDAWDEILEKWPGDKPATVMRERAAEFMQAPERWSGDTATTISARWSRSITSRGPGGVASRSSR